MNSSYVDEKGSRVIDYVYDTAGNLAERTVLGNDLTLSTPMIPIKRGSLYLTAVIDWYSRCIVGWEVDETLDTRMVISALKKLSK